MVRTYRRKTSRAGTSPDTMLKAVRQVLLFKKTIRGAADEFGINYRTLARYCSKIPRAEVEGPAERPSCSVGFVGARQVFSSAQEAQLRSYLLQAFEVNQALPSRAARRLCYELAETLRLTMPLSWNQNGQASADWLSAFLKRHPRPIACTLSCPIQGFYTKLVELMVRYAFGPEDVWAMEEAGVCAARRLVARRGAMCGPLVSVVCAVSAAGAVLPPFFVFPRVRLREQLLAGAPVGSSGAAHLSGWMREQQFVLFLQHFSRHTGSSRPRLLLLGNHGALLSIAALAALQADAITALAVPPPLQPLEEPVFGPIRNAISTAMDTWTLARPGRSLTLQHVPALVGSALPRAVSAESIACGFSTCGIFPLNPSNQYRPTPQSSNRTDPLHCPALQSPDTTDPLH